MFKIREGDSDLRQAQGAGGGPSRFPCPAWEATPLHQLQKGGFVSSCL